MKLNNTNYRVGIECLPNMYKALVSVPSTTKQITTPNHMYGNITMKFLCMFNIQINKTNYSSIKYIVERNERRPI
jgi:hypothetical protein